MDDSNIDNVAQLKPEGATAAVIKMRDFDEEGVGQDVPDPYYGGENGFQLVFEILERSTENLLNKLVEKHHLA